MDKKISSNVIYITKAVMGGGKSIGLYAELPDILIDERVVIAVPSKSLAREAKDNALQNNIAASTISIILSADEDNHATISRQPVPVQIRAALGDSSTQLIIVTHAALRMFDWSKVANRPTRLVVDEHLGELVSFGQIVAPKSADRNNVSKSDIESLYAKLSEFCEVASEQELNDQTEYIIKDSSAKESKRLEKVAGLSSPLINGIATAFNTGYRVFKAHDSHLDWFKYSIFDFAGMVECFTKVTLLTADTEDQIEMKVLEQQGLEIVIDGEEVLETILDVEKYHSGGSYTDEPTFDNIFGPMLEMIFSGKKIDGLMKYKKLQSFTNINNLIITNYLDSHLSQRKLKTAFTWVEAEMSNSGYWKEVPEKSITGVEQSFFEIVLDDVVTKINGEPFVLLTNQRYRDRINQLKEDPKWADRLENIVLLNKNAHGLNAYRDYRNAVVIYSSNLPPKLKSIGLSGLAQLTGINTDELEQLWKNSSCYSTCAQSLGRIAIRLHEDIGEPINFYVCDSGAFEWLIEQPFKDIPEGNLIRNPINFEFESVTRQSDKQNEKQLFIERVAELLEPELKHTMNDIVLILEKEGKTVSKRTVQRTKQDAIKQGILNVS